MLSTLTLHQNRAEGIRTGDCKRAEQVHRRGFRIRSSFIPSAAGLQLADIGPIEEGMFSGDQWQPGRRLDGDENDQGTFWRFGNGVVRIETANVYRYRSRLPQDYSSLPRSTVATRSPCGSNTLKFATPPIRSLSCQPSICSGLLEAKRTAVVRSQLVKLRTFVTA